MFRPDRISRSRLEASEAVMYRFLRGTTLPFSGVLIEGSACRYFGLLAFETSKTYVRLACSDWTKSISQFWNCPYARFSGSMPLISERSSGKCPSLTARSSSKFPEVKAISPSSLKTEKERLPPASVIPSSAVAKNSDFLPNQTTPSGSLVTFVRVEFKMILRSSKMSMSVMFVAPAEKLVITEAFVRFTKTRALFSCSVTTATLSERMSTCEGLGSLALRTPGRPVRLMMSVVQAMGSGSEMFTRSRTPGSSMVMAAQVSSGLMSTESGKPARSMVRRTLWSVTLITLSSPVSVPLSKVTSARKPFTATSVGCVSNPSVPSSVGTAASVMSTKPTV
mmetsp:Transcript_89323/g.213349  ORF Transcript_89323/g.213349 Transcript_89323/m.213349 type:complete len:337 (+) Transcript_89323:918-1928(+)